MKAFYYLIGVILLLIGFVLFNIGVSNGSGILAGAVLIGLGVVFMLCSYI